MDTRSKILTADALARLAAGPGGARVATGHFDPLLASHARRLAAARDGVRPLIVLITDPADPVLDARARAELVAALESVDGVGVATPEILARVPATALLRLEDDDDRDRAAVTRLAHEKR